MADSTKEEKKFEKVEAKKEPWTVKKILTTVIIAVLALLMVGGAYYFFAMIQQSKDTTGVFGYYDGTPVKLAYNTVFYNTLMSDEDYISAATSGDYNGLYTSYSKAYQSEVVFQGLSKLAKEAKIVAPEKLVNQLVIASGQFAGEDGSTFDPQVYKDSSLALKNTAFNYYKMMYPYQYVGQDYYTVLTSDAEGDFVSDLANDAISLSYFAIDYTVYPDELASAYDISGMEKATDADGNVVEPTLDEIKAYIFQNEPEAVQAVIDEKLTAAVAAENAEGFEAAAEAADCSVVAISGVVNNYYGSSYLYGIAQLDSKGNLAEVIDEELSKTLFTAEDGYVVGPITAEDGSYVFVRVDSSDAESAYAYIANLMYQYYSAQSVFYDEAQCIFASDKFTDNFTTAFWSMLISNVAGN